MKQVGIWHIDQNKPVRVKASEIDLERHLEEWIECDPTLLEEGLQIVGRQVKTRGGRLDLLAIDMQGRWTVIELKPSSLYREALAQALDYASCVAEMEPETLERVVDGYLRKTVVGDSRTARSILEEAGGLESLGPVPREVQIILVGTGRASNLDRVTSFLSDSFAAPIKTVAFQVFEPEPGRKILLRELASGDEVPKSEETKTSSDEKLREVRFRADAAGTRELLEDFLRVAEELDLHRRPWGRSVMFSPQENKTICLFTLWIDSYKGGRVRLWVVPTEIAKYFPVSEEEAVGALGGDSGRRVTHGEARETLTIVRSLIGGEPDP